MVNTVLSRDILALPKLSHICNGGPTSCFEIGCKLIRVKAILLSPILNKKPGCY